MKRPLVFSFINEQRKFLLILLGFLIFMMVVSAGLVLSLGTAIGRFSSNLEKTAIIMGDSKSATKIITEFNPQITETKVIDKEEGVKLLKNWITSTDAISSYIPYTVQIKAKTSEALNKIAKRVDNEKLRFVSGISATPDKSVGIKIMLISGMIFFAIFAALIVCVMHSVKNIIMIHKREIEILNQIGSTNNYIANQIGRVMIGIVLRSGASGLGAGWIMIFLISTLSNSAKVGLLANMGMTRIDWLITFIIAVMVMIVIVFITYRTTIKILEK